MYGLSTKKAAIVQGWLVVEVQLLSLLNPQPINNCMLVPSCQVRHLDYELTTRFVITDLKVVKSKINQTQEDDSFVRLI